MILLLVIAAALAALAGALVLAFARRARAAGAVDPTLATYKRQLAEVDELAGRGLLSGEEREAARAEAGRRLLKAADTATDTATGTAPAWAAPAVAGAAAVLALGLYLAVGRPDAPDQPFAERVRAWREAPEQIGPAEAAAVIEDIVKSRPTDAEAHTQLGRARLAGGDAFGAVRALERATQLEPKAASRWADLGRALLAMEPPAAEEAERALRRALGLAPGDPNARYWLGHALVARGDIAAGVAEWRALAAGLPADDPRRGALAAEIAAAQAPPTASAIEGMVEGLAARLKAQPDDPAGWARLARAYAVMGREAELQAALGEARQRFSGEALARIEAEAAAGRRLRSGG